MSGRALPPAEMPNERWGRLHIYLGAAPGVGKTYAMVQEGRALAGRGLDVVVGWVETHGGDRKRAAPLELETIPPKQVTYHGTSFLEIDLDGVLARKPDVVLVDELAHTNVAGGRHDKRWQDVEEILTAGIDVLTNVNVQHIDGLARTVAALTGVTPHETVPDAVLLAADTLELVDVSPEELIDRVRGGDVYTEEGSEAALAGYFNPANLVTVRELALRWLEHHQRRPSDGTADERVPVALTGPVVAALTGAPEGDHVIRRASEFARASEAPLIGVHVREPSGLVDAELPWLGRQRRLLAELCGRYAEVSGVDVARAVLDFARAERATHLVLGATRRSRREELLHGSVINRAIREARDVEVHVIPSLETPKRRDWSTLPALRRAGRVPLPPKRRLLGWALALGAPVAVGAVLVPLRSSLGLAGALFCVLLAVVASAVVGGLAPASVATIVGVLAADFFFARPYYSLRVDRLIDVVALTAFAVVACVVGVLVDVLARQGVQIAGSNARAASLARLAATRIATTDQRWVATLESLRETFSLGSVALLRHDGGEWHVEASAGSPVPATPDDATLRAELPDGRILAFVGEVPTSAGASLLNAFVDALRLEGERAQLGRLVPRASAAVEQ